MKRLFYLATFITCIQLQGCGDGMIKNKTGNDSLASDLQDTTIQQPVKIANESLIVKDIKDLTGNWVGMFEPDTAIETILTGEVTAWNYDNKINISIDKISNDTVIGHSVVAGNDRPFSGTLEKDGLAFNFSVKEPGTDKYDGVFKFTIMKRDSVLTGTWKAYKKLHISKRTYTLVKKNFKYNPSYELDTRRYVDWKRRKRIIDPELDMGYDDTYFTTTDDVNNYNASTDELTKTQVANMKKADLFVLRNSIYARHGYSFKDQQLRAYFDRQPWYIPINTNVKGEFTELEKKNIELLMRYEKNAKEYYDVFGRG